MDNRLLDVQAHGNAIKVREMIAEGARGMLARDKFMARDIDHIFRCAQAILRDHADRTVVPTTEVTRVLVLWKGLISGAQLEAMRLRTIYRLNQPEYL